jgi:hypothetical protein
MRILSVDKGPPQWTLPYLNAGPRGGTYHAELPILRGTIGALPGPLAGLLVTSDLQGVAPLRSEGGALALLGQVLVEHMVELAASQKVPPLDRIGVLLAGDLYSAPQGDQRGATGDVRRVWQAFSERFRWVAGVGGNHDLFGTPRERESFTSLPGVHFLDGTATELDGLRIGGVSGIIGNPRKPGRRDDATFFELLDRALFSRPELLILHEGPDVPRIRRPGTASIRELIEVARRDLLVICGHAHWHEPLAQLDSGSQVLNVDARAVLLFPG